MPSPFDPFISKYLVMTFILAPKNCDTVTRIMPFPCSQNDWALARHWDQRDGSGGGGGPWLSRSEEELDEYERSKGA